MADDGLAPVTWLRPARSDEAWFEPERSGPAQPTEAGSSSEHGEPIPFPRSAAHDAPDEDDTELDPQLDQAQIEKISLQALTRRGVSSREMRNLLVSRGVEADAASAEVERLERVALLDDTALAETLVRTLRDRKGLGKTALKAELGRRLIDQAAIESALDETDTDDEAARAREVALKRAPQLRSLAHDVAVRRLSAFLMRKGYSGSVVRDAVDAALGGYRRGPGNPSSVRFE